ncbi:MAG TPA: TlpA disulfide reductase family protein [Candidatus Polarisedimenticolia bacterium]|jgi:peroxiredoxin|nr:TlpA disulfide reductase family protein [Candidatus Polarisedimenticolia bacterium]
MPRARILLLAAAFAAAPVAADQRPGGPSLVGRMAPSFTLPDLSGRSVSLESFRGKQVVQIVGWASWCHGCRQEIPRLKDAYEKYHSEGFEILALTGPIGQGLNDVKTFARRMALPYPVLYDEGQKVLEQYQVFFVPYTCLLDRDGKVVYEGSHLPNDYEKRIEKLLRRDPGA